MKTVVSSAEIIQYYSSSQWLYDYFWSPKAHGMHVGFWDHATHSVDAAVENENATVLAYANLKDSDRVLDAGCGVGGTSIYFGKHSNVTIVGVTLVESQVVMANAFARSANLYPRVSFQVADFMNLPFADNSFDVIIGIESICHAYPKNAFLAEAHRVLRSGGRLVIADGYMKHVPKNTKDRNARDLFCKSFALSELIDVQAMELSIKKSGFRKVTKIDKTADVLSGAAALYRKSQLLQSLIPFVSKLPFAWAQSVVRNAAAAQASMGLLSSGVGWYGIFTAIK